MKTKDRALLRSSHEQVSVALMVVARKHRDAAKAEGLEFIEFFCNEEKKEAMFQEMELTCILLGWTLDEHVQYEHEQIMKELSLAN